MSTDHLTVTNMARPKKEIVAGMSNPNPQPVHKIEHLSVDYPSEGLNNMARKINEIIDAIQK